MLAATANMIYLVPRDHAKELYRDGPGLTIDDGMLFSGFEPNKSIEVEEA